jgi:hypothetical protein
MHAEAQRDTARLVDQRDYRRTAGRLNDIGRAARARAEIDALTRWAG